MTFSNRVLAAALLALAVPAFLVAQSTPSPAPGSVSAEATRTDTPPELDGNVLDDKAWAGAKVITGFWQTAPDEGEPASEAA